MGDTSVLIVADDAAFFDRLKAGFVSARPDVEVISALSGPRALGIAAQRRPSAILIDANLMGVDGYQLTEQMKADPTIGSTPIVILADQPNEASALRARQVGAAAHMPQSIEAAVLIQKVLSLAGNGSSPSVAPAASPTPATNPAPGPMPVVPPLGAQAPTTSASAAPPAHETAFAMPPQPMPMPRVADPMGAPSGYGSPAPAPGGPSPAGYGAPASAPSHELRMGGGGLGGPGEEVPHIDDLLRLMLERGGSDLHITVGSSPGIRQRGEIVPVETYKPLSPRDTQQMILSLLSEEQRKRFETELELDFAYSIPGVSRFRANVFQQRNSMGAVFRVIPIKIPTLEDLALPKVCKYLAERPRGLVLVTGPTGSGKSTTLSAMVNHINETRSLHIITLEDPIEFMHRNKKAFVNQREVGEDTHSFASALKRVLRQDPDVILVGEMRDLETISAAITAAETGHLVFATLHTTGGPETIDRIIDVFPPHQQQQVRMQLSSSLEGVLSQVLLRSTDGRSRVMAMEILLGIPSIANLIREGKTHQMDTIVQAGAQYGMQTLDQHLKALLQAGKVTFEEAIGKAKNPRELAQMVGRKL